MKKVLMLVFVSVVLLGVMPCTMSAAADDSKNLTFLSLLLAEKTSPQILFQNLHNKAAVTTSEIIEIEGIANGVFSINWRNSGNNKTGSVAVDNNLHWSSGSIPLVEGDNSIDFSVGGSILATATVTKNVQSIAFLSDLTFSEDEVPVNATTQLIMTVSLDSSQGNIQTVKLHKSANDGSLFDEVVEMKDDGQTAISGDDVQGDGVFSCKHALTSDETKEAGELYYRVQATTKTSEKGLSSVNYIVVYKQPTTEDFKYTEEKATEVADLWNNLQPKAALFKSKAAYTQSFESAQDQLVVKIKENKDNIFAISGTNGVFFVNDGMPFVMMQETIPDLSEWEEELDDGVSIERGSAPKISGSLQPVYTVSLSGSNQNGITAKGIVTPQSATTDKNIIKNKNALFIDPYYWQHVHSTKMTDANGGWTKIKASDAPEIDPATGVLNGTDTSASTDPKRKSTEIIDAFTTLSNYGTVLIHTHGGIGNFKGGSWLSDLIKKYNATANPVTKVLLKYFIEQIVESNILSDEKLVVFSTDTYTNTDFLSLLLHKYASDIQLGRLYVTTSGKILVTPAFISKHNGTFPNSVIWLGACHSLENTTMSSVFLAKKAGAVFGFDESVYRSWNVSRAGVVFEEMLENGKTAKEAFDIAIAAGNDDGHGTSLVLKGNEDLKYTSALVNPSFEDPDGTGSLQGWSSNGDARVWKFFQNDTPTDESNMAVISSGLGHTVEYGSISQTFTMPENASMLNFDWNFYSAEFKEWCNKGYDDTFRMLINNVEVFRTSVDILCQNQGALIATAPIDDTADTFKSGWKNAAINVSAYAGENVALKAEIQDKGDTIFDSAVLLDNFVIETTE